ncbi:hypothetical protein B0T17DRAFT_544926 [Bombardia bombarda]|uniref:F-box domain-containing protein n=1 Tax=Bombardia bombarda TaxID=252184 RepID=A0AA39TWU1_9PEZI|nr:hypothetical protein B0T17DRAFT_544926 [Bombardia bombarda]
MTSTTSPLLELPIELYLDIVDYLPLSAVATLSLTCKAAFEITRIWKKQLWIQLRRNKSRKHHTIPFKTCPNLPERMELLKALSKDLPRHEPCYFCATLHRLPDLENPMPQAEDIIRIGKKKKADWKELKWCWWQEHGPRWYGGRWGLRFRDVSLVMQRHMLGDGFGRPLSSISTSTDWERLYSDLEGFVKLDTEAAFINNDLVLHVAHKMWCPIDLSVMPRAHSDEHDVLKYVPFNIAIHLMATYEWELDLARPETRAFDPLYSSMGIDCHYTDEGSAIDEIDEKWPREASVSLPACDTGRRRYCQYIYDVTVRIHCDSKLGFEVIVDMWVNCGQYSFESPHEGGWLWLWYDKTTSNYFVDRFQQSLETPEWSDIKTDERVTEVTKAPYEHFRLGRGESGISHPSSAAVLDHWRKVGYGVNVTGEVKDQETAGAGEQKNP